MVNLKKFLKILIFSYTLEAVLLGGSFSDSLLSSISSNSLPRCPDNSEWLRMCKIDSDCIFRDEICAEGKCCPGKLYAIKAVKYANNLLKHKSLLNIISLNYA